MTHHPVNSREDELIRGILAGEDSACSVFVVRYGDRLHTRIVRQIGDSEEAFDLTQEALTTALQRIRQLRRRDRFLPWLFRVADNTVRMWRRRRMVQMRLDQLWSESLLESSAPPEPEMAIRRQVRSALQRLSSVHREALVQHYYRRTTYAGMADLFGLPVDTVRSRLQKARLQLKKEIEQMNNSTVEPLTIPFQRDDLALLCAASRFTSDDPNRLVLSGVDIDSGGVVVATDGHRLLRWSSERLALLPVPVLLGPWRDTDLPDAESSVLTLLEDKAILSLPGSENQVVHLMDESFPDYRRVIPAEWTITADMDAKNFLSVLDLIAEQLELRHPAREEEGWTYTPTVELILSATEQTLAVVTTRAMGYSFKEGEEWRLPEPDPVGDWMYRVSLPARIEGLKETDRFRIRVNHSYLLTAIQTLNAMGTQMLTARFIDAEHAMAFTPTNQEDHLALIMPMRMEPER